ncbi:hypothetical protein PQX77_004310 [Marasmius sp. AFHP31]|nr:hypothetical protein PQX77_004310 [Marasmius sp. AFHP31]
MLNSYQLKDGSAECTWLNQSQSVGSDMHPGGPTLSGSSLGFSVVPMPDVASHSSSQLPVSDQAGSVTGSENLEAFNRHEQDGPLGASEAVDVATTRTSAGNSSIMHSGLAPDLEVTESIAQSNFDPGQTATLTNCPTDMYSDQLNVSLSCGPSAPASSPVSGRESRIEGTFGFKEDAIGEPCSNHVWQITRGSHVSNPTDVQASSLFRHVHL